jgi:MFS family permease
MAPPHSAEMRPRMHPAWIVAAVTLLALVAGAAFRSSTGALLQPLEDEFGWTRVQTSGAVTANLVVYGLTAPFAAAAMERFGIKRVVLAGLALCALGSGLTVVMSQVWQLWALWGLFVGVGTGVMALVFGSIVANRWFVTHRGLVMGIFSGGNACGQLIFLQNNQFSSHDPSIQRVGENVSRSFFASTVWGENAPLQARRSQIRGKMFF